MPSGTTTPPSPTERSEPAFDTATDRCHPMCERDLRRARLRRVLAVVLTEVRRLQDAEIGRRIVDRVRHDRSPVIAIVGPAGRRSSATGELMWLPEIAQLLRDELGEAAARVSTEVFEDDEALVGLVPGIGRRNTHTTAKARGLLGWTPRPGREAVLDSARSLVAFGAV